MKSAQPCSNSRSASSKTCAQPGTLGSAAPEKLELFKVYTSKKSGKPPYQEPELFEAEGVGTAEVIRQPAGRGDDNVGFAGELQRLRHHVCAKNTDELPATGHGPQNWLVSEAGKRRSPYSPQPWVLGNSSPVQWKFSLCGETPPAPWAGLRFPHCTHPGRPPPRSPSAPAASPGRGTARRSGTPAPCGEDGAEPGPVANGGASRARPSPERGRPVPGGGQHEAEDAVGILGQHLQHRQHERRRLPAARLGAAQAVATCEGGGRRTVSGR